MTVAPGGPLPAPPLEPQALGEGHERIIAAVHQKERHAEPRQVASGDRASSSWSVARAGRPEAVDPLGIAVGGEGARLVEQVGVGLDETTDGVLVNGAAADGPKAYSPVSVKRSSSRDDA